MDCVACGKPISITAKFCGKCGAPVKRIAKPAEAPLANEASAESTVAPAEVNPVDEMSFTLSPPEHMADMREIDLELRPTPGHYSGTGFTRDVRKYACSYPFSR
jgi:hypothetical protein